MSLAATVANPLTDPVPAGWDAFVTEQRLLPVWRSQLLRTADWCSQAASALVLVCEASSSEPIACFHTRHIGPARVDRFVPPGRVPMISLTECRVQPSFSPGLAFADTLDDRDRSEVCQVFERALRRHTGGRRALSYRFLLDRHLPVVPAAGRIRLQLSPGMVVVNEWPDLASYYASLPGKWRSQLKKIHGTIRDDDRLRVGVVETIEPDEACWLTNVVNRRHLSRLLPRPPLPARYIQQLAQLPGTRFVTYRDSGGRLLGYNCFYDDGQDLVLFWWGARSDKDGGLRNLYFDQYLRLVELMLSKGRRRLLLGSGMAEIKSRYRARPEPRWGLVGLR